MDDSECYVDVLIAADDWQKLSEQDDEPTDDQLDAAHDTLADAVQALREFEAAHGTAVRDEPWGGTREAMIGVLDAADAWYVVSIEDEDIELDESVADAVLDALGEAVRVLREAEAERDEAILRGDFGEVLQRVMRERTGLEPD